MARKSDTDDVIRFTVGVLLFIPFAAYFLLRWLLHGLIWLITVISAKQKTAARKKSISAIKSEKNPRLLEKKSIESSKIGDDTEEPDFGEEDDSDLWDEECDHSECVSKRLPEGPQESYQVRSGDSVKTQPIRLENIAVRKDDPGMATIIGAGKYVFGEDLPMGKYDLTVVSGSGGLTIRYGDTEDDENWIEMGLDKDYAREYRNLSLEQGKYFMLDDNLRVEITRSKMLKIDP